MWGILLGLNKEWALALKASAEVSRARITFLKDALWEWWENSVATQGLVLEEGPLRHSLMILSFSKILKLASKLVYPQSKF